MTSCQVSSRVPSPYFGLPSAEGPEINILPGATVAISRETLDLWLSKRWLKVAFDQERLVIGEVGSKPPEKMPDEHLARLNAIPWSAPQPQNHVHRKL